MIFAIFVLPKIFKANQVKSMEWYLPEKNIQTVSNHFAYVDEWMMLSFVTVAFMRRNDPNWICFDRKLWTVMHAFF